MWSCGRAVRWACDDVVVKRCDTVVWEYGGVEVYLVVLGVPLWLRLCGGGGAVWVLWRCDDMAVRWCRGAPPLLRLLLRIRVLISYLNANDLAYHTPHPLHPCRKVHHILLTIIKIISQALDLPLLPLKTRIPTSCIIQPLLPIQVHTPRLKETVAAQAWNACL